MLFNSVAFLFFLPIVLILYWLVGRGNLRHQNVLLLVSSYFFYGWWDYRFLALIFLSTLIDYVVGLKIDQVVYAQQRRKWLMVSIIFNLGLLGFFKYYNFFVQSWVDSFELIGYQMDPWTLNIVLPVGISFYTFQTMSYSLDVYSRKLKPTRNFVDFAAFVSFFPQLVAGPIERASNLLPQIQRRRSCDPGAWFDGLELVVWGFFKKVVIADSLSEPVHLIFSSYEGYSGGALILGVLFFALQIYCDFSGYSDIAIGISKWFGIELMQNFNFPYFSKSISEFWHKWHISLSTWFRDYLYLPIGGSRVPLSRGSINVLIVFIVSGFWHGANWTFLAWGFLHGAYFIPSFVLRKSHINLASTLPSSRTVRILIELSQVILTFVLVCIGWIFFRSENLHQAFDFIGHISLTYSFEFVKELKYVVLFLFFEILIFQVKRLKLERFSFPIVRYGVYTYFILSVVSHATKHGSNFIYFQF